MTGELYSMCTAIVRRMAASHGDYDKMAMSLGALCVPEKKETEQE